ncbi:MAG TPA: hypothetical protein VGH14_04795 [Solirubrobacterales bacterium]|jgi:hypothetical protein
MAIVRSIGLPCLLYLLVMLFGAAPAQAAPAPGWDVMVTSYPTNFEAPSTGGGEIGPGYAVVFRNVGAAPTSGPFEVNVQLPSGTTLAPAGAAGKYGPTAVSISHNLSCSLAGQVVTCTGTEPVYPGQEGTVRIPLQVSGSAAGDLQAEAAIEGAGAAPAEAEIRTQVSAASVPFAFLPGSTGAFGAAAAEDGSAVTAAGSHPYQLTIGMNFTTESPEVIGETLFVPGGGVRSISGELPQGLVVDPQATPQKCTELELVHDECPDASQVGVSRVAAALSGTPGAFFTPLYNMFPPPGSPAELGFEAIQGTYIHLFGRLRSSGDYGLSADVVNAPAKIGIIGAEVTLWGDPGDPSHDHVRSNACINNGGECEAEPTRAPFLSMPSSCSAGPLQTLLRISSWGGDEQVTSYPSVDPQGDPVGIDGCNQLNFAPTIESKATTGSGESPSGLDFSIHQQQEESLGGRSTANLKDTTVELPAGMTVNASAANGLAACSSAQIGLLTPVGQSVPIHISSNPQGCPPASELGSIEVGTPLLDHPLHGSVFLAKPFDNPFASLLGLYLAIEDEETGIIAKLAGKVEPDPATGQLTAIFAENPELPLEDIKLHLFKGPRAPLSTPLECGGHQTTAALTPWSTPARADAYASDSFQTSTGCVASEGAASKGYFFSAGTTSPLSGTYSRFVLKLSRGDGTQHITGIDTTLPEGLLGRLAGVAYCSESAIARGRSREAPEEGRLEQQDPSCPASSEVGTVNVTAGSGEDPIPVSGHAYLAGPYKGALLSLVVIVPAVAGPFDLGTVVDRVALNVGEYDARIHAVADPLPTIRDGIPLDVRSIELNLDRSGFTLNPTSCDPMAIEGLVSTQAGQTAPLHNRFQVGECGRLAFKPSLKLSLKGATKRTGHPALKAVVIYPQKGEYANIARAQVSLPHSEFLDQGNLNKVCKQTELSAGSCPAKAIYGKVKAWTPLLEKPLEGNVYLGVGFGYKLPALVAELNGQIRVLLKAKTDTDKQKGIRSTFEAVPDAPVSRFVLELKGGTKYGLLENSEDLCKKTQKAGAAFRAQNGRVEKLSVKIANSCKKGRGQKKHKKQRHHR